MGLTFQEQLAALPVPRLSTVLRLSLSLRNHASFDIAASILTAWWNQKAAPYDIQIDSGKDQLTFSRSGFSVEYARREGALALVMEEPDSSVEGRSWMTDVALWRDAAGAQISLRSSYREPYSSKLSPAETRAPLMLREIVEQAEAVDVSPLSAQPIEVGRELLPLLIESLESKQRTLPMIVVSRHGNTNCCSIDPAKLAERLAGTAHVVVLSEEASWDLTREWGKDWSVFAGGVRCYYPDLRRGEDKLRHKLWIPERILQLDAATRNGFFEALSRHVFTQITARFEPVPLLTPAVIRRQIILQRSTCARPAVPGEACSVRPRPDPVSPGAAAPQPARGKRIELSETVAELQRRLREQEETALRLERDLEQERAGRAEAERLLRERQDELRMYEEEVVRLDQQASLALGDVSREPSEALRPIWGGFSELLQSMQTMARQFHRMEEDAKRFYELSEQLSRANQLILSQKATIESLNRRRPAGEGSSFEAVPRKPLEQSLPALIGNHLTLAGILNILSLLFPDRVVILDSAIKSAEESRQFLHCEQAFDLLWCLATDYWQALQSKGDVEARKLLGSNYSARDKTQISKAGKERRVFTYKNQPLLMEKHLKIGTAYNSADTLRVHFEWIAEERRIVIGHCGKHLAF